MDTFLTIGEELINFNAADYLLLALVGVFFFSGLGYRIKATAETMRLHREVEKTKAEVEKLSVKEKSLREEVQNLLNVQSVNMVEINRLKSQKMGMGKLPITMGKDLEDLIAWCHQQKISVNFDRRMAAKRLTPKGKRL